MLCQSQVWRAAVSIATYLLPLYAIMMYDSRLRVGYKRFRVGYRTCYVPPSTAVTHHHVMN